MSLGLPTPAQFPAFPYSPPYKIQIDLMRHLYASIEQSKVTIIESPTGTGKTLSLLCASLTWLTDEKNRARKGKLDAVTSEDAPDWVIAQTRERHLREFEADEKEYEERLGNARKKEAAMRKKAMARVTKKTKPSCELKHEESDDDAVFLPESDAFPIDDDNISPAVRALMARVEKGPKQSFLDQEAEPTCTKIYYASRTHSQLAQILPELRRLKLSPLPSSSSTSPPAPFLPSSHPPNKRSADERDADEETAVSYSRTVSLGSRKQLCINDDLQSEIGDLDEGCRELLGQKGNKRCQYLPPIGDDVRMVELRDQILAFPKDIEDLATAGRIMHTCPYFGSRRAIPQAELVTLPYNLLLQKSAREALGIDLRGQVVIIDEAHNLIPTLLSLSTTRLPFLTLSKSLNQVCVYISKFRTRLLAENILHLKRLVVFLDALKKYVSEWKELILRTSQEGKGKERMEVLTVAELLDRLGRKVGGVNLLEVEGYLRRSKIARKIASYSDKESEKNADPANSRHPKRGTIPPLHHVEAFMLSLTGTNDDGRITLSLTGSPGQEEVELKYQLLNPSPHFVEVVDTARAVILAGGTMSPISDVANQLFSHLPPNRLSNFSCGHIIPSSNLQTLVIGKGPRGGDLEFKAGRQGDSTVLAELGQILLNFANVVPGGLIVFFPSYNFLNMAKAVWQQSGMLEKLRPKKKVFFEPEANTDVEKVLQEYSTAIRAPPSADSHKRGGAMLFAVIGAKLSEGLNFADDLARAVIIIGLPFANLGSPELRERMKYVKRLEEKGVFKRCAGQKDAAAELYENMCMNAVNQSIGRAIRHRGDWASLILLDRRYASNAIRNKLPKWIGSKMVVTESFGQAVKDMGSFYRNKRT